MAVTRRRLFQLGVGGTLLLGVGGAFRWLRVGYVLGPQDRAIGLGVKELAIVRALVDAIVPPADGMASGLKLGVPQRIDEEAWAADDGFRRDLAAGLAVLEHCPPLFGYFGRFTALERKDREAVLRRMLASSHDALAAVAFGLKQLVHAMYYAREETWEAVGYDGPWVLDPRPPASSLAYQELLEKARSTG